MQRLLPLAVLLIALPACGGSGEPATTAAPLPSGVTTPAATVDTTIPAGATPGVEPGFGVEPGTGTDVALTPPETAAAEQRIEVPMTVTAGRGDVQWDTARLDVAVEGRVTASHDLDLGALEEGGAVTGNLVVDIAAGSSEELSHGAVTVTLELLDGSEVATARRSRLGLMADERTVFLGFVGPTDLERARLQALLDAGEITQEEFDRAYAATLEKVTGTVEQKDG